MEESDNKRTTLLVDIGEDLWAHTVLSQSLEGTGGGKGAGVGNTHNGDQDDGVEDGWQDLDSGKLDGNDEWGVATGGSLTLVQRAVGWDNKADEEQVDDVEDADTPNHLLGSFGYLLARIFSLGSGETSQFSATEGEGCSDEDGAEAVETVEETRPRSMPVPGSNVASVIGGNATAVDDDSEDHCVC